MKFKKLLRYLWEQGHFHIVGDDGFVSEACCWKTVSDLRADSGGFCHAVRSWQKFRPQLRVDGDFGPVCEHALCAEKGLRCKLPDIMEKRADLSEWPESCQRAITTAHKIGSLSYRDSQRHSIDDAWDYGITRWNLVSGIILSRIAEFSNARVRATANRESSGILAWSYLPNNSCSETLSQSYNSRVSWNWRLLWTTICHEIGHAIGLPHGGRGMMQPANDPSTTALVQWDIDQAVRRYGPPKPVDPPDPPAPPEPTEEYGILEWFKAGKPVGKYDVIPRAEIFKR